MIAEIFAAGMTVLVIIHGLIHLIGFRVYAQGAQVSDVPFKTTFLNDTLDLGISGIRIYGYLWLLSALGFIIAGVGFILHVNGWQSVLIAASLISIVVTVMDWQTAFRGTLVDLVLLGATLLLPIAARFGIAL